MKQQPTTPDPQSLLQQTQLRWPPFSSIVHGRYESIGKGNGAEQAPIPSSRPLFCIAATQLSSAWSRVLPAAGPKNSCQGETLVTTEMSLPDWRRAVQQPRVLIWARDKGRRLARATAHLCHWSQILLAQYKQGLSLPGRG
ncbi:acyl-CoA synthetase family member 3, mitochondrial [Platysternon megacephalum]|uniref:Acyl-CoA synthetase family member 3, mitochondrial n=1 Tax=Platysternon megacephalum TaxID=55544 RepID=A0A4D9EE27_9SAUR|nr:acyl-CoA synthetase family member 3, mitochondrial [Platysternon megacephalum]